MRRTGALLAALAATTSTLLLGRHSAAAERTPKNARQGRNGGGGRKPDQAKPWQFSASSFSSTTELTTSSTSTQTSDNAQWYLDILEKQNKLMGREAGPPPPSPVGAPVTPDMPTSRNDESDTPQESSFPSPMPSVEPSQEPSHEPSPTLTSSTAPDSALNEIHMCYSNRTSGVFVRGDYELDRGLLTTTDLPVVKLREGESLYVKVVASTFSVLNTASLNQECKGFIFGSSSLSSLRVRVDLSSVDSTFTIFTKPEPSRDLVLRFDRHDAKQMDEQPLNEENLLISGDQSVGEFYFPHIPVDGNYQLTFRMFFDAFAYSECYMDHTANKMGVASIGLGPHILSYQKVELKDRVGCYMTETARRRGRMMRGRNLREDVIDLCYQSTPMSSSAVIMSNQNEVADQSTFTVDFGELEVDEGDGVFAHVMASSYAVLGHQLLDSCFRDNQFAGEVLLLVGVVMRDSNGTVYLPEPGPFLVLSNPGSFGLGLRGNFTEQARERFINEGLKSGDFYFRNLTKGVYSLAYELALSATVQNDCFSNDQVVPMYANIDLGPRLFAVETVHLDDQEECRTTLGTDRRGRALERSSSLRFCYQPGFSANVTARAEDATTRSESVSVEVNFGSVELNGDEDLHVKFSASTISFARDVLFAHEDDGEDSIAACAFSQNTNQTSAIYLSIVVRNEETEETVPAIPSQRITLAYNSQVRNTRDDEGTPFVYNATFGRREMGQSTGEFFFMDMPRGAYTLNMKLDLSVTAFANCRRPNHRTLAHLTPSVMFLDVGPHLVTLEKVDLVSSGGCTSIAEGSVIPLPLVV